MNKEVESIIQKQEPEELRKAIQLYEKKNPDDFDLYSYYVQLYIMTGDYDKAITYAKIAAEKNPFSIEASYNYAVCADLSGFVPTAYEYYNRTLLLQEKSELHLVSDDELKKCIVLQYNKASEKEKRDIYNIKIKLDYAVEDPFKSWTYPIIGKCLTDIRGQEYYVGRSEGWFEAYFDNERNQDSIHAKCELFPLEQIDNTFIVDCPGEECMVPVVLNYEKGKRHNFIMDSAQSEALYPETARCKYCYFPVKDHAEFIAEKPALYAKPVPLVQKKEKNKKRLVLNIFMDSFNYCVIEKYGLKNIAPNIFNFFSKGLLCSNFYAGSEFTLPSLATYWTGIHSAKHMNLSEILRWDFMKQEKVFPEYFKEAGYVTAKIGGNNSITPAQGYLAGFDRTVYQLATEGYLVHSVVADTIEHLKTFRNTNQFVFIDIPDLHGVAGGFMRSMSVQSETPLKYRSFDNNGGNTVKQNHSFNKEKIYLHELERIDTYLGFLFDYIEDHYSEDEILVSLFSDHGTAFIVEDNQPFLSQQRVNVPFFVRCAPFSNQTCDEVIESSDYSGIMCKLAGIEYNYDGTDANLPVIFGGRKERPYAFSQSFFAGDLYRAGFHGKDFHIYIESKNEVNKEERVDMSEVDFYAFDSNGNDITEQIDREFYEEQAKKEIAHLILYNE